MKFVQGAAMMLLLAAVAASAAMQATNGPSVSVHGVYDVKHPAYINQAVPIACGSRFYYFPGQDDKNITAVDVQTLTDIYSIPAPPPESFNSIGFQSFYCTSVDGYVVYAVENLALPPDPTETNRFLLAPNGTLLATLGSGFRSFGQYLVTIDNEVYNITTGADITNSVPSIIWQGVPVYNKSPCVSKPGKKRCRDSNGQEEKLLVYAYSPNSASQYTSTTLTNYETLEVVAQFNEIYKNAPFSAAQDTFVGSDPYFYYFYDPTSDGQIIYAWNKTDAATGLPKKNFSAPADVTFTLPSGNVLSSEQPAFNGKIVTFPSVGLFTGTKHLTTFDAKGTRLHATTIGYDVDGPYPAPAFSGPTRNTWTIWNTTATVPRTVDGTANISIQVYNYPWNGGLSTTQVTGLRGTPGNTGFSGWNGFSLGPKTGLFVGIGHMPGEGMRTKYNFQVWGVDQVAGPGLLYTSEKFPFESPYGVLPEVQMFWFVTKIVGQDQLASKITFYQWQV